MVKLKVLARVIPEDTYLTATETTSVKNTVIAGEKRFYVIVREPDTWYIGTLALEIKRRYESLYKHDLGQIKYLKDNTDDCDLDPELLVSDALVDEGKVLTDPSDQHVVVRVIQEQGRAVRIGSVVPDLSQVHYQLPEQPSRPPVPTFPSVDSSLGKRKAGGEAHATSVDFKRTRLDEIEEDRPLASIEHDQPVQSNIIVHNSQGLSEGALPTQIQQSRIPASSELSWSFSQIGPPTLIPATSQTQQDDQRPTSSTADVSARTQVLNGTPNANIQKLKSPKVNGLQSVSPLAAASSASKKFLKPRRDIYAEPESDIDDSQMSPSSRDTTRITPRLVPSGRNRGGDSDKEITESSAVTKEPSGYSNPIKRAGAFKLPNGTKSSPASTEEDDQAEGRIDDEKAGLQPDEESDASGSRVDILQRQKSNEGNAANSDASRRVLPATQNDIDVDASDAPSRSSRNAGKKKSRTRNRKSTAQRAEEELTESKKISETNTSKVARTIMSNITTPEPDSPSEQLSQSLQESTRKATDRPPTQLRTAKSASTPLKEKVKTKADQRKNKSTDVASKVEKRAQSPTPVDRAAINTKTSEVSTPVIKRSENDALGVPTNSRAVREASSDSHITDSSKVILPPGMTPEQYDRLVRGNTDLLAAGVQLSRKRKSTPSLRQTPSTELPAKEGDSIVTKPKKTVKTAENKTPTSSTKKAEKPSISVTKQSAENSPAAKINEKAKAGIDKQAAVAASASALANLKAQTKTSETKKKATPAKGQSTSTKPPSPADSESTRSEKSKSSSTKAISSITSTSSQSAKAASQSTSKPTSAPAKEPTPTPSTASKAMSSAPKKQTTKEPPSSATKSMQPPSVSSITKSATGVTTTPTPKPKAKPIPSATATSIPKPITKAPLRSVGLQSLSSARNLQELRAMANANSAATSTSNSPAPSSRFTTQPKKSVLNHSSSEDSSSDSNSDSDSDSPPPKKPISTATKATGPSTPRAKPDPTVRDRDDSDDDDDDDDESSSDG